MTVGFNQSEALLDIENEKESAQRILREFERLCDNKDNFVDLTVIYPTFKQITLKNVDFILDGNIATSPAEEYAMWNSILNDLTNCKTAFEERIAPDNILKTKDEIYIQRNYPLHEKLSRLVTSLDQASEKILSIQHTLYPAYCDAELNRILASATPGQQIMIERLRSEIQTIDKNEPDGAMKTAKIQQSILKTHQELSKGRFLKLFKTQSQLEEVLENFTNQSFKPVSVAVSPSLKEK